MLVESVVLSSGQTIDVISNTDRPHRAGVILLHGSGTSERLSLRALGVALADQRIAAVIPDWYPSAKEDSLDPVLDFADEVFGHFQLDPRLTTILGYSAGGRVALSLTLDEPSRFSRCVAIASSSFDLSAVEPAGLEDRDLRVLLVHGDSDVVRPASVSESLCDQLRSCGAASQVVVIENGTHSNVVCATFEPSLQLSNPAAELTLPMHQSVAAITKFVLG